MPKTVEEYIAATQALLDQSELETHVDPTSAILDYNHNSSMVGGAVASGPDFGYIVAYCLLGLLPGQFEEDIQEHWHVSDDEFTRRRQAAESGFRQLLADFVREGYKSEMGERLLDIGNENFYECSLEDLYVLPQDLDEVIARFGNPLSDPDDEDSEEEAESAAQIGFGLDNPRHRELLGERLLNSML